MTAARYVTGQINGGPWSPPTDTKRRVALQIIRALGAAQEDDVLTLVR